MCVAAKQPLHSSTNWRACIQADSDEEIWRVLTLAVADQQHATAHAIELLLYIQGTELQSLKRFRRVHTCSFENQSEGGRNWYPPRSMGIWSWWMRS
jgi:hypothetical protein